MARHIIGGPFDDSELNMLNDNFEQLFDNLGTASGTKQSFDSVKLNSGKLYPLINFSMDGVEQTYTQKVLDSILDVKIHGAEYGKVYQLDSVRNGLSGSYGVRISSFDAPVEGDLDSSTRKLVLDLRDDDVQLVRDYESNPNILTITTEIENGVSAVVTIDTQKTGTITNLSENWQGYAFGTIIHPSNYFYSAIQSNVGGDSLTIDEKVYVDKGLDDMNIYVPSVGGSYIGFNMYRRTIEFSQGNQFSNVDLWAINRISRYFRNGQDFTEDTDNVYVYNRTNTTTMDTIFRLVGEDDYSGGFYHGDEILEVFNIFVGGEDVTNKSGQFSGGSVEVLQQTKIYEDTITAGNLTVPYLKVKKMHKFNKNDGYTLKSRIEFLKTVDVEFSNIGSLSMSRLDPEGNKNFKTAIDMDNMEAHDISTSGTIPFGDNVKQWKFTGDNREVVVTVESDSNYLGTWVRNSESDTKLYSRVVPTNGTSEAGEIINSSVNYKFDTYLR